MDISFLFPRRIDSAIAGLEEAKNLAGEVLRLIQIFLTPAEFSKIFAGMSTKFAASADRRSNSRNAVSFSSARTT